MPTKIRPMLATSVEQPFDNPDWLFEIKWDGYRAIAFIAKGRVRLVSRNQNDLTGQFPELTDLPEIYQSGDRHTRWRDCRARRARPSSFSLMQQRTGIRARRTAPGNPPRYSHALLRLRSALPRWLRPAPGGAGGSQEGDCRYRGRHGDGHPCDTPIIIPRARRCLKWRRQKGLEGILAKRRDSYYEERRTQNWLKIKMTQSLDCVVGGYTDPEGSRAYFGSIVLGLYDKNKELIHVGQAGSGFDQASLKEVWRELHKAGDEPQPFSPRRGSFAKSTLGEAGTGSGDQVFGMDPRYERRRRQVTRSGIYGPAER